MQALHAGNLPQDVRQITLLERCWRNLRIRTIEKHFVRAKILVDSAPGNVRVGPRCAFAPARRHLLSTVKNSPAHKKIAALSSIRRKLGSNGGRTVEDWKFTQQDHSEALAKLHFFSIKKKHAHGEVEARITVKEFATAKTTDMKFFAVADIELNQKSMKFQPCGWAETLLGALTECLRNLRKFEYESPEVPVETSADGAQL
jgi:hypothetical protein